jgi:hypothetical protein
MTNFGFELISFRFVKNNHRMSFITKLKTAFGSQKAKEKDVITDTTDAIIKDIDNTPFAISESNVLYAGLNELGGYYFFQTVIVGTFHIKTVKGAQLKILGHDFELFLDSDMIELESDRSNISNRSISKIDFQIEETDAAKLDRASVKHLILTAKNEAITFSRYELSKEEEEE